MSAVKVAYVLDEFPVTSQTFVAWEIEEVSRQRGEIHLRVMTSHGVTIPFTMPIRSVVVFYERVKAQL